MGGVSREVSGRLSRDAGATQLQEPAASCRPDARCSDGLTARILVPGLPPPLSLHDPLNISLRCVHPALPFLSLPQRVGV